MAGDEGSGRRCSACGAPAEHPAPGLAVEPAGLNPLAPAADYETMLRNGARARGH